MNVAEIIERKREGGPTTPEELEALVHGLLDESVPTYQISAWLMAVLFRGMTGAETADFTRIMMESGEILDLSELPGIKVDKHSTGGVGDKISIPLAPLVASAGVVVPMISGRGLGHTGGTLDKLESIPGLNTKLPTKRFRRVLDEIGFSIVGANENLAPADRKLYALRDVTGTVPSVPLITGSILSKKYAAGVDALVLDVKTGSGAFMREREAAVDLARVLVNVSKEMGKRAKALVTSMDQPLGKAVGNALEITESVAVLRGEGPDDVVELVLRLGAEMMVLAEIETDPDRARATLENKISSGEGLETFRRWVIAQDGDPRALENPQALPRAPLVREVASPGSGFVTEIDTREVGFAANAMGAGRAQVGDAIDPAVGFVFRAKLGDEVAKGQPLVEIHAPGEAAAEAAARRLLAGIRLGDARPHVGPLIVEPGIVPS